MNSMILRRETFYRRLKY